MISDDPILGPVRWCGHCKEWWPDDGEFFYSYDRRCKACVSEKKMIVRARYRAAHLEQIRATDRARKAS